MKRIVVSRVCPVCRKEEALPVTSQIEKGEVVTIGVEAHVCGKCQNSLTKGEYGLMLFPLFFGLFAIFIAVLAQAFGIPFIFAPKQACDLALAGLIWVFVYAIAAVFWRITKRG